MRRRYRADTVLRMMMLAVAAGLMLAWFAKALAVKDSLLGAVTGRGHAGEAAEEREGLAGGRLTAAEEIAGGWPGITGQMTDGRRSAADEFSDESPSAGGKTDSETAARQAARKQRFRQRLAVWLVDFLQGRSPLGRVVDGESGLGNAAGDDVWQNAVNSGWRTGTGAAFRSGTGGGLWTAVYGFFLARSPLLRFLTGEAGMSAGVSFDADPSYAAYLARQKLKMQPWYLIFSGQTGVAGQAGENANGASQALWPSGNTEAGTGLTGDATDSARISALQDTEMRRLAGLTPAYHRRDGLSITGNAYVLEQLSDYDFLMQNFYSVHASTTADRAEFDAVSLLGRDLSIDKTADGPQILIYHTHSQEEYSDFGPENPQATVVGIGNRLTELLEEKGYTVIHDTTPYDILHGELDRNHAYNYALDGITAILQKYPGIQVVLDLHRDGVAENVRLVTEIDGRPAARIMFFNGMSQTPDGPIEYLPNPYKEDNLAFSLQMQIDAAAYYPGFTRKIYLKGLRYNLHVRPRSALIEVGAQTNTYEEALNAMEPLAELLDMTLGG